MKKILALSIIALGLAGCTPREQQLVAAGAVGALAGAVVANGVSDSSYNRTHYRSRPYDPYYAPPRPYYHPRPAYNPYVYHAPRHPQCFIVDRHTPYGIRRERVCR
jgi:hypothetical protein